MKKILVIDDDPVTVHTLESILSSNQYDVLKASDGQQGLDVLKKTDINLIILDVQMPNMNGYSFIFELKKIKGAFEIPLIVLTSKEEMEEIFKAEGVQDYLVKPISKDILIQTVQKYV